jgi:hypothetical protein
MIVLGYQKVFPESSWSPGCGNLGATMKTSLLILPLLFGAAQLVSLSAADDSPSISESLRAELLQAREAAWRAFFADDPGPAVEHALSPNLIAIQESDANWQNRAQLIAIAKDLHAKDVKLVRLEFPRTEIQLFGQTAILYYTYVFETGINGKSTGVDAGRGTEIFVKENGRWIDAGWHLDNGPFYLKDGHWVKNGPHPEPHDQKLSG